jgi:hypothetical protein
MMAEEAIRSFATALPRIIADRGDKEARSDALHGAWLCGACLGVVGMALHHKLCHVLGGSFDLPHAETHAVVLPYAVAYNAPAASEAMDRVARALGAQNAAKGLFELADRVGAPRSPFRPWDAARGDQQSCRSGPRQSLLEPPPNRTRLPPPSHRGSLGGRAARLTGLRRLGSPSLTSATALGLDTGHSDRRIRGKRTIIRR